jgi:putative nucleotidyltransferase with HDIG domain
MSEAVIREQAVVDFVLGIGNLPTPPVVFSQIVRTVDDPDSSAYSVAKLISEDPGMAAAVLRMTNSSFYALNSPVTSVKQAVVVIGLDAVKSLVVSASMLNMFKAEATGEEFQEKFWRHSLATAFGARMLMRAVRPADIALAELAFTGGLLHDIGKMALCLHAPDVFREITVQLREGCERELELERSAFGFDHAAVGGALTRRWNLPQELSSAIAHHHAPMSIDDPLALVDILHVADALSHHALSEPGAELTAPAIEPAVFARSGLRLEDVGGHVEGLKKEYVNAETFLGLVRSGA